MVGRRAVGVGGIAEGEAHDALVEEALEREGHLASSSVLADAARQAHVEFTWVSLDITTGLEQPLGAATTTMHQRRAAARSVRVCWMNGKQM